MQIRRIAIVLCLLAFALPAMAEPPGPPTAVLTVQTFCKGATLEDIAVTGENIQWYTAATGGTPLPKDTELVDNTRYYASQTVDAEESAARLEIRVIVMLFTGGEIVPAKAMICAGENVRINNLVEPPHGGQWEPGVGWGVNIARWEYSEDGGETWKNIPVFTRDLQHPIKVATTFRRVASRTINSVTCERVSNEVTVEVHKVDPGKIAFSDGQKELPACRYYTNIDVDILSKVRGTGDGEISYRWEKGNYVPHFNSSNSIGEDEDLKGPIWHVDSENYRRVTISDLNGHICQAVSDTVRFVRGWIGDVGAVRGSQVICPGDTPTEMENTREAKFIVLAPGEDPGRELRYRWQHDSGGDGWVDVEEGGNGLNYQPGPLAKTTTFRRQVIASLNGRECVHEGGGSWTTVTVNNVSAGTIRDYQVVCAGAKAANIDSKNGDNGSGGSGYIWQKSPTGDPDGDDWEIIPYAANRWYNPGAMAEDTYYRRGRVGVADNGTCEAYSNVSHVKVDKVRIGKFHPSDWTVCTDKTPILLKSVEDGSGAGVISYQWRYRTATGTSSVIIENATEKDYMITEPLTQSTSFTRHTFSTSIVNGIPKTCSGGLYTVRVKVNPVKPGSISGNQTICPNEKPDPLLHSTAPDVPNGAQTTYRWERSTDDTNWETIPGTHPKTGSYSFKETLAETTWFRRVAISKWQGSTCEAPSDPVTVTVNDLYPGVIAADQTLCAAGDVPDPLENVVLGYGAGTSPGYTWQRSTNGIDWTDVANEIGPDLAPTDPITVTTQYRRMAHSFINGKDCKLPTDPVTIALVQPNGGLISADAAVCAGVAPNPIASDSPGLPAGEVSYRWYSRTASDTDWQPINGAEEETYQPGALSVETRFIRETVPMHAVAGCTAFSNPVTISVTAVPAPTGPTVRYICKGSPALSAHLKAIGSAIQWYDVADGGVPLFSGSDLGYSLTEGKTYYASQTLGGCESKDRLAQAVKAEIEVKGGEISTPNPILCHTGQEKLVLQSVTDPTIVDPTNGEGVVSYVWGYRSASGAIYEIIGNAQGMEMDVNWDPDVLLDGYMNTVYRVAIIGFEDTEHGARGCQATSNEVTVKINHVDPGSISASTATICAGMPSKAIIGSDRPATSLTGGKTTYRWEYSHTGNDNDWHLADGTNDDVSYQPGTLLDKTWFRRVAISDMSGKDPAMTEKCETPSNVVVIDVRPAGQCKVITEKLVSDKPDGNGNELAEAGEVLTYTIKVSHNFANDITVKISDQVPAHTSIAGLEGHITNGGVLSPSDQTITWNLTIPGTGTGDEDDYEEMVVSFKIRVADNLTGVDWIRNTVTVSDLPSTVQPNPQKGNVDIRTNPIREYKASKSSPGDDGKAEAGEVLTFAIKVENTGSVDLMGIEVKDDIPAGTTYVPGSANLGGTPTGSGNTLHWTIDVPVGQTETLIFQVKVADDLTGIKRIDNIAFVDGKPTNGYQITTDQQADLSLTKTADWNTVYKLHDKIPYTITVKNEGNVTLENVVVRDDNADGKLVGNVPKLAPGKNETWTVYHTVKQPDVDRGYVYNLARATASDPNSNTEISITSTDPNICSSCPTDPSCPTCTVVPVEQHPGSGMSVTKTVVNRKSAYTLGEVIDYSITVKNTGSLTLKDILVTDPNADADPGLVGLGGATNPIPTLAPGQEKTFTAKHKVVQADVDAGQVDNQATAKGKDPQGNPVEDVSKDPTCPTCPKTTAPVVQSPDMAVTKKVSNKKPKHRLGEVVHYQITVENTGDVTLTDILVTDPNADANPGIVGVGGATNPIPTLAPKQKKTFAAQHKIVQADVDAGKVFNFAVAGGRDPNDQPITVESNDPDCPSCPETVVDVEQGSAVLSLTKKLKSQKTVYDLNEVVEYEITVQNTGDLTLTDIIVADDNADAPNTWTVVRLAPTDAPVTFTAQHKVVLADVDAGKVDNIAVAAGKDPQDNAVTVESQNIRVDVDQNPGPGMSVTKTVTDPRPIYALGDVVEYAITVENTGGLTLMDIIVADPNADNPNLGTIDILAPGDAPVTFTAQHRVEQADVDAGRVDNIAVAEGIDPANNAVTAESANIRVTVDQPKGVAMELTKELVDPKPVYTFGDAVAYKITVKNTGSVTLKDILVSDPNAEAPNTWEIASLEPDAESTIDAWHPVAPADVDAGRVDNIAVAAGKDPEDSAVTAESEKISVSIAQNPNMAVKKRVVKPKTIYALGDVVEYEVTVENTGDVTLTNIIVTDANADNPNLGTIASLATGATSAPFPARHKVVQADVDAGQVDNIAVAVGKDPNDRPITVESEDPDCPSCPETTVPVDQGKGAEMAVTKTVVNPKTIYALGDVVEYEITVTNTGDLTLTNIIVTDANADSPNVGTVAHLAPGTAPVTFTAQHKVEQADVDAGKVDNTAVAVAKDPQNNDLTVASAEISVPVSQGKGAEMDVTKTVVNPKTIYAIGDVVEYEITVTNTGDLTLANIIVTDVKADNPNVGTIASLAPGTAPVTFTARHKVVQADVDAGKVDNIAVAVGIDPQNNDLMVASAEISVPVSQGKGADMSLTKAVRNKLVYALGDVVEYEITVTNTGDLTLTDIKITDANADNPNVGTVASLAPGVSESFSARHTVNPSDMDRGYVPNIALAKGDDPQGNEVTAESTNPDYANDEPADPRCPTCTVVNILKPIEAVDDHFEIDWLQSRSVSGSVLDNDLFDHTPLDPAQVVLTPMTPGHPGLRMHTDGTITVGSAVVPGRYTYPYSICEVANPENCSAAVAVIEVHPADRNRVFIPNVFSPNGDGVNDLFEITGIADFERVSVEVINRWGNQLYHSEDYQNDWDGDDLATGTYYYIVRLYKDGKEAQKIKGWVSILR